MNNEKDSRVIQKIISPNETKGHQPNDVNRGYQPGREGAGYQPGDTNRPEGLKPPNTGSGKTSPADKSGTADKK